MLKQLCGVARVNFLSLTLVCIALAAGASWQAGHLLSPGVLMLVTAIGLCAHISVNALNEYLDFKSGLDFLTNRTPFSGGSGTLVTHPGAAHLALLLGIVSMLLVIGGGLYLSYQLNWQPLLIGIPGVLLIYGYTRHINRWPLLCLLAPGIGFGIFMTLGSYWVLAGNISATAWLLAMIITLLVSNLLLLNQFPDAEADRQVGRRHLPIVIGRRHSASVYTLLLLLSYLVLILGVLSGILPWQCLLALLSLALVIRIIPDLFRYADKPAQLTNVLGLNVMLCHLYPLLLGTGLIWAGQAN
ncbi:MULTISPECIES: prenyltransferase [unclassified Arsukibacterium]|uniref:prenyltransferase n=1 Tax=unclassified Arsukibacterium TaxID=2635278 RepID=UPI000C69DC9A|nr:MULTISPECIES: prenyltransferase [unclassified Arsukibacterium]MAA95752.1 1,4-dihydroxy-2-naphthoate prenyltransferase [Rheinheimera sp.]MBM33600.1 1,4-dihydroxy-2-naphthoate prenyltransferase [Rheinheimera sp.]HAW92816.1 1,4-dihydroxy-2-naphthoate prenyltransferase [Candidatus Azambacteria bacterium]